jgi:hypothetical protein
MQPQKVPADVLVAKHGGQETPPTGPETESAPAPELVSAAARQLARLPRRPKRRWSGWIGDVRSHRDMPILLPNGRRAWVFGAQRNKVVFTFDKGRLLATLTPAQRWGVLPADQVQVIKNESAVLLGRLKRGVIEVKSEAKAASARHNGRQPPKPGSRGRGRPSRHHAPYLPVSPQADDSGQQERREPWRIRSVA